MIFALLPRGTGVRELGTVRGLSPGLLSAGLGGVSVEQTYLDITQGNRVFDSLYSSNLPELGVHRGRVSGWKEAVARANSAPAAIAPGLLASTLADAGLVVQAAPRLGPPALLATDRQGRLARATSQPGPVKTLEVRAASLRQLPQLIAGLRRNDLLIALERPPPARDRALAIGIAGRGFEGNLTSASTRLDGYVLSTDVAPTILRRLGVAAPSRMAGQPIRVEGSIDPRAVASLGSRLGVISRRRGPVIGVGILVWLIVVGLAIAITRGRAARLGVRLLGISVVYLPLLLLAGGALEPSEAVEQLIVLAGTPLLAALTLAALGGYRALGVASGLTVLAYAIDMVAGSPLTTLSLLGPNPGLGVRFYGIGNELEALLAVLIVAGTGAGLDGFAARLSPRGRAAAFLGVGLSLAFLFAAGRYGADVGAAIVFPIGAAVAAAAVAARRRRTALLAIAAPILVLALLVVIDLASGANAHLTRSVLDAGGLNDLANVAQRRLQLSVRSFARPIVFVFMPLLVVFVTLALIKRELLRAWLQGRPAMRAGLIGAVAATLVGTLANDSGALLLEIGAAYLLVFAGFAWAQATDQPGRYP